MVASRTRALAAATVLLLLVGCSEPPRSTIHGTVTYQEKPIASATVVFFGSDNQVYRAELGADGSYAIEGVIQGPLKVCVQQAPPRPPSRPEPSEAGKGPQAQSEGQDEEEKARPKMPSPKRPLAGQVRRPRDFRVGVRADGSGPGMVRQSGLAVSIHVRPRPGSRPNVSFFRNACGKR